MNALLEEQGVAGAVTPARRLADAQQRILVVEDDAEIRRLNAGALRHHGYKVDTAADGAEGWEMLRLGKYDLLVTDYEMPRMSGMDLVSTARSAHLTLPVVLASGSLPTDEMERRQLLKFVVVLPKPYFPQELVAVVSQALHAPEDTPPQAYVTLPFPFASGLHLKPPSRWGINE